MSFHAQSSPYGSSCNSQFILGAHPMHPQNISQSSSHASDQFSPNNDPPSSSLRTFSFPSHMIPQTMVHVPPLNDLSTSIPGRQVSVPVGVTASNSPGQLPGQLQSSTTTSKSHVPNSDTASAMTTYRKYYTDVLAYFKTLLDKTEEAPPSLEHQPHAATSSSLQNLAPPENDAWTHSKTIMAGYFRQKGDRDWDWASWHNYLSWISRTHPEWFRLFIDCSKQMGINWEVMYKQWMASKPSTEDLLPTFDLSRPPPKSVTNPEQAPPPPIANPLSLTSVPPPSDPRVWCEDCDQYFSTQRVYDIHLRGVCHIQNALTKTITNNASIVLDIPQPSQTFLLQLPPMSYQPPAKPPRNPQKPSQKPQLRLQHLLDVCIQPLVGLNYITEFQRCGLLDCIYICDLCKRRPFLPPEVIRHVCGVRHRMAYLKQHYPPLYRLMNLDKSHSPLRVRRLASYAQQIESTEGRKRPSIMREKDNSSMKTSVCRKPPKPVASVRSPPPPPQRPPRLPTPPPLTSVTGSTFPTKLDKPTEPLRPTTAGCASEDDEIEEGEMLDFSSGDDEEDLLGVSPKPPPQSSSVVAGGLTTPPTPFSSFSSASSSPTTRRDEEEETDCHRLPSFFTCGIDENGEKGVERNCSPSGPIIHLPDFEVGFVSERPPVPTFDGDGDDAVVADFVERLSSGGVLNVAAPREEDKKSSTSKKVEDLPFFSQLAQSFEDEVAWALKLISGVSHRTNPLQFTYDQPQNSPSPPPVPHAQLGSILDEQLETNSQGSSIDAITSSSLTTTTNQQENCRPLPTVTPLTALPEPIRGPDELRRAAQAFLAKLEGRSPPPNTQILPHPPAHPSKSPSALHPPPAPSPPRPGQSIPVLTSLNPPRLLLQDLFEGPTSATKRAASETAEMTTALMDPKRSRVDVTEKEETATPAQNTQNGETDGVTSLLSSPLDALQALLQGGFKPPTTAAVSSSSSSSSKATSKTPSTTVSKPLLPTPPSTTSSAAIFDGYTYTYSRQQQQLEQRSRANSSASAASWHPPPHLPSSTGSASTPRPRGPCPSQQRAGAGSRLAAFADMLGMNEPPPKPPPPPAQHPSSSQPLLPHPQNSLQSMAPTVPQLPGSVLVAAGLNPAAWMAAVQQMQYPSLGAPMPVHHAHPPQHQSIDPTTAAAATLMLASSMLNGGQGRPNQLPPPGWRR